MVSLGQNFNMSSGARFLSENPNTNGGGSSSMEDERQQLFDPVLTADNSDLFRPLRTTTAFSFQLFVSILISFTGVILAALWPDSKRCEAYFIMLYLRAAFWAVTFIFDHVIKHHHEQLRMNGYHEFHRSTSVHRGLPFYVVSLWNTVILALGAFMQHFYGTNFAEKCIQGFFSPVVYVTALCVTETIALVAINGSYIARVYRFNKSAPPPDALRGSHLGSGSVGLLQPGANVAELLEKQADLISYLKEHNLKLNQKLMQLNAQVRNMSTLPSN